MQRSNGRIVLSASDIVRHLGCEHLTTLNLLHLAEPQPGAAVDEQALLLARKGDNWERQYLGRLRTEHPDLVEIERDVDAAAAVAATQAAMARGVSHIFQAALTAPGFFGRADFLRRVPGPSALGDFHYEVLDTKLARRPKASHVIQLCFYSWLLEEAQGVAPRFMHIVLGDGSLSTHRYADYARYFHRLRERTRRAVEDRRTDTYPDPCEQCETCRWNARCEAQRIADDHLWQVAGITRTQIRRLHDAGIRSMQALAQVPATQHVPKMSPDTLARARAQAAMQVRGLKAGSPCFELKPPEPERGFQRLPPPSEGDIYFDMEGDPLHEDNGLEYLFGVSWREAGELRFRAFWAHDRAAEKAAFEAFIDWVQARLQRWPDLHIYHYASYENTALKRLMSLHGTRERQVDDFLRQRRLVDLYRVVTEALVASTDSYSIKKIETFYRPAGRSGDVTNAGASVVWYERWRETQDPQLLKDIERYNRDDCESTAELHAWLRRIRPDTLEWRSVGAATPAEDDEPDERAPLDDQAREREALKAQLLELAPQDPLAESIAWLIDFHQREAKPTWWKVFSCADLTEQELIDDIECIGGLRRLAVHPPTVKGRPPTWVFEYPEQEFKAQLDRSPTRADTAANVTLAEIDEQTRRLSLKPSKRALEPDAARLSLGPPAPIKTPTIRAAVMRFAAAYARGEDRYQALRTLLRKDAPQLRGHISGAPLVRQLPATLEEITAAVAALDHSYLFLQGPPGAGKTYTGSHVIVELMRAGKRVAISSNSHKAIHNLLAGVEDAADARHFRFSGVKKADRKDADKQFQGRIIQNVFSNDEALGGHTDLVAGTAWLFADEQADEQFDYLFIDEAGQISLGHLVAMGVAARNIVLLGDQMQLSQPIQGVHPGRTGESVLEYLLDGHATVPPDRGIFLANTWRMHPNVCAFISDAVYDGQLKSAPGLERQTLVLARGHHAALRSTGVRFWPVEHDACAQKSEEEADEICALYDSLLRQKWRDRHDERRDITADDVLVVAPYNMQVNLLRQKLPAGARVGTVDKFQGQEAAVVLVSMATSSGEYLPRDIEFLYSKSRINVALSRAKCLAILVASPRLLDIRCKTPAQIELVNTLCWAVEYSRAADRMA